MSETVVLETPAAGAPVQLRPLGIGQLLDQSLRIYRRNFVRFVGIVALVMIPTQLLNFFFSWLVSKDMLQSLSSSGSVRGGIFTPSYFIGLGGSFLLSFVAAILYQLAAAALVPVVAGDHLGRPISWKEAYQGVARHALPLIITMLVGVVFYGGLILWGAIPCIGWFTGLGALLVFGMVVWPLTTPIVILEHCNGLEAMLRAWGLGRQRFWSTFGYALLLNLLAQIFVTVPVVLISFAFQYLAGGVIYQHPDLFIWQTVLQSLVSTISAILYYPLMWTAFTSLYFDLRVRLEGFDLAVMAQQVPESLETMAQTMRPVNFQGKAGWITGDEIGAFVAISVGGVVLIILLYVAIFAVAFSSAMSSF